MKSEILSIIPLQAWILGGWVNRKYVQGFVVKTDATWAVFNKAHQYLGTVQSAYTNDDKPSSEAADLIIKDYKDNNADH